MAAHGIFSLALFPKAPKDPALSPDSGTFDLINVRCFVKSGASSVLAHAPTSAFRNLVLIPFELNLKTKKKKGCLSSGKRMTITWPMLCK